MRRLIALVLLLVLPALPAGLNHPIQSTQSDGRFTANGHESALFPMTTLGSTARFPDDGVATDFSVQVLAPSATTCTWNVLCTNKILSRTADQPIPDSQLNSLSVADLSCLDGDAQRMTYFIGFPQGSCKVRLVSFAGGTEASFYIQGISP